MRRFALPSSTLVAWIGGATPVLAGDGAVTASFAQVALRAGLSLAAVLAAIAVLALLVRRLNPARAQRSSGQRLASLARLDLGARREIRLIEADGRTLVVGVTPERLQLLTELPADTPSEASEDQPALRVLRELTTSS